MKSNNLNIFLASLLILTARPSFAEDEITIKGDIMTHNKAEDTVRADGNVIIQREDITVTSEHGTYNRETGVATVQGNVVIKKGEGTLRGEWGTLDTTSGRGELHNGISTHNISATKQKNDTNKRNEKKIEPTTMQSSNMTVRGDTIIRNEDGTLTIKNADLTTCDIPDPSWKFTSSNMNVDPEGYAVGSNIFFHIMDIPVLYFPWFAFPATKENKSGFLFPKIGSSSKRGFQLDVPFYWAISPSQDVVFDVDLETKRGVGLGVNYRYKRKHGSEGELLGYLIHDKMDDRWRGRLNGFHNEIISPDFNIRAHINLTSDRTFLSDYGLQNGEYNRQSDDTVVNALKTWQNFALTASLRYRKDYYSGTNSGTLQTLPEIGVSAVRQRILTTPAYFDMDSTATNFYRSNGPRGQRLYAFPRLSFLTGLPGYLNATIYAGTHLRGYDTNKIPSGSDIRKRTGNMLPEIGATISSSFSRVYDVNGEHLKKLRHELVPEISYRYVPDRDQSRLPLYDYTDRLVHQNVIYYGITSYLNGKFQNGEATEYRDISMIRLMQGYSISGTRRDLLTLADDSRHMTDLMLESETWLYKGVKLLFDARYDLNNNRLSSAAPGLQFSNNQSNTNASIQYIMSRNNITTANQVEYLQANISTQFFNPWTLAFSTRYSLDKPGILENVYSVTYQHKCWSVIFSFHDRPGNTSFTFNFQLAGVPLKL